MKLAVDAVLCGIFCGVIVVYHVSCKSLPAGDDRSVEEEDNPWLSDLIDYDYMGDAPARLSNAADTCPPIALVPSGVCDQTKPCNSDRECESGDHNKCCYDGCTYTCLPEVGTPAYLDWIREPRRRLSSGRSWLINGAESVNEAEPCSTTPPDQDEDPLLCPHGYICSIEDPGELKEGIPNRGHCIKEVDDRPAPKKSQAPKTRKRKRKRKRPHGKKFCEVKGFRILEAAMYKKDGKVCHCKKGSLICTADS